MSVNGGLVILKEMLAALPPSEKRIATYIINHPDEAIQLTAMELGKRSSTSGAAVIRLCKSLNLNGFQDLKIRIAGDLQKGNVDGYSDIEPKEETKSIINKMTSNSIETMKETAELLSEIDIDKTVSAMQKAEKIHFFGVGASSIIAQDAHQKFLRINKISTAYTDLHMAATQVANAGKEDVVVGISFSGNTMEVAKLLQLAKKNNSTTISLTKYGNNQVTAIADINLYTSATTEPTFRSAATSSRLAQLQVIDILFMCVASLQYDDTVKHLEATRKAISLLTEKGKSSRKNL
ncbi:MULTISPECIES: MurR/RpiR family transcriptional regulator [Gracilibacillus]|uniref:MurR/RpiR family transcriptional regulator n=1 Tax=Gracilibacillus TaxID=74385 RepID=UPI00082646A4|nr:MULTISPECIES: MurR/RpiR family transcriptional regulator [Gracilibacillus]